MFYGHVFPLRLIPVLLIVYTLQYHPLFVKILSRLYYCCTVDRFPPDLCIYKCKEFSVHGTISSVVFQNIITTAVLETRFPPPDFCLYKRKQLELRVSSKRFTGMIRKKKTYASLTGLRMPVSPYIT